MKGKNEEKIKLELLAPAKDLASGRLAIVAGADAVYIGGPLFSARSAAGNPWEDVAALVSFAHQYYAKVYLALNTIFFDEEIKAVKEYIDKAYKIGVDALIIQDMGILEMDLPPLPLFASTQAHNYEAQQIKFLEEAGFSRVILARELSLEGLREIKRKTAIGLECFAHGALCVSFSGRCYFSQVLSGRSANRGKCAQPCRQTFDLVDRKGKVLVKDKYLLSLKDLNLSEALGDLAEAGATSFKIEGRLKDAAYIGNVTAKYRQELDRIISASDGKYARSSSGKTELSFEPDLAKTFNRGYTEYFLHGRPDEVVSTDTQKSLGEFVGRVKEARGGWFVLDREHDLKNADGICWFDRDGQLGGTNVNLVKDGKIYPNKNLPLSAGAMVFRNDDPAFERAVEKGARRFIEVDFIVRETKSGLAIEAIDEDGNSAELKVKAAKTIAEKGDLALRNWQQQLGRLGETIFCARDIIFEWEKPLFAPLSTLNDWRRDLIAKLLKARAKNYPRLLVEHKKTEHPFPVSALDHSFNVSNKLAKSFYERHGAKIAEKALESQNDYRGQKLMTTKHCLKYWLGACPKRKGKRSLAAGVEFEEPLYLVREGRKFRLNFDCGNCLMEIWNKE